jgi:hypothetical protein
MSTIPLPSDITERLQAAIDRIQQWRTSHASSNSLPTHELLDMCDEELARCIESAEWRNFTADRANEQACLLFDGGQLNGLYNNIIAKIVRPYIDTLAIEMSSMVMRVPQVNDRIRHKISWHVMHAVLRETLDPECECVYFRDAREFIEAWCLPIGWSGMYPSGHLQVWRMREDSLGAS